MSDAALDILLVEDNPAEIRLTVEGFREGRLGGRVHAVTDGDQALDYLKRRGAFAEAPRPDLIVLDLNLPGIDGRSVLRAIKQDESLKTIPVLVMSSSEAESDIFESYAAHANCFIAKPIDFTNFITVVRAIENFWFTVARLP